MGTVVGEMLYMPIPEKKQRVGLIQQSYGHTSPSTSKPPLTCLPWVGFAAFRGAQGAFPSCHCFIWFLFWFQPLDLHDHQ